MTELARYEAPATPTPITYATDPTGGRLIAWADGLAAAHRIGSALCQTAFVPASFRGKPEEAAAAILYGDEIGLTPTQSLQSVHVISGRPGLYARAMVALALSKGHEVWTVEKSDAKVTVAGRRKGSTHVHEETWTTARAQKAGYTTNKKYSTDPQAMLYARAAADVVRQVAPDALAGLDYAVEELELSEAPTVTVTRTTAPATKAQRKPAPPTPEPPAPPLEPAAPELTPEADELRTEAQSRAMFAMSREKFATPEEFRAWLAQYHEGSTKDMSRATAKRVLDALDALPIDADVIDPDTGEVQG